MKDLFAFNIPQLHDIYAYESENIADALETIAMSAYYLAGDDQMDLKVLIEDQIGIPMEDYKPDEKYIKALYELDDIINGYNFFLTENSISAPPLYVMVDKERNSMLNNPSEYQVYQVSNHPQ